MTERQNSILVIGEAGVGKTHYGAQLLKRLMNVKGSLRMDGAATNLQPFETALDRISEGIAADHTPTSTYVESIWPVADDDGRKGTLIWPDYGGEQIKTMLASRQVPSAWSARVTEADTWMVLVRLQQTRVHDDVFSRPLTQLKGIGSEKTEVNISDQARLIELLQMLLYVRSIHMDVPIHRPRIAVLLTCWDELRISDSPVDALANGLPLLSDFVTGNWAQPFILGVSALGRPLQLNVADPEYAMKGPEKFGYVVLRDGTRSPDLTLPIRMLMSTD